MTVHLTQTDNLSVRVPWTLVTFIYGLVTGGALATGIVLLSCGVPVGTIPLAGAALLLIVGFVAVAG